MSNRFKLTIPNSCPSSSQMEPSNKDFSNNNKDDFLFKTPKIKELPNCSYRIPQTENLKACSDLKNRTNKTISFSTGIINQNNLNANCTPKKKLLKYPFKSSSSGSKVDLSRILSNKLIKKSKFSSKSCSTVISNTATSTTTINNNKRTSGSYLLIAIVEGRGVASGEIGMASIDLKNPELELSQFSDSVGYSRTLSKLYLKDPIEIVFPHTMCEDGVRSKLFQIVSEFMHSSSITTIHRRYYNDKTGKESIQHICHKDYTSVLYECREKYYALAACAAIIKYVEFIQNMLFAPTSLKIIFTGSVKCMMLDISTIRNLELVQNSKDLTDSGSLFTALNFTTTTGGHRLLRANLLQPSIDIPTILSRYDCVEELMKNSELFFTLKSQIRHFISLNHLLSLCVQLPKNKTVKSAENTITQIIALKHVMELIPTLRTTLKSFKSSLFIEYQSLLVDSRYDDILSMINVIVHEDVHFEKGILQMRSQKLFAIKDGVNVILDVARRSYSEQIEALRDEVQGLSEEYSLPLRVAFSNSRGFYIQISQNNLKVKPRLSLPFIKILTVKKMLTCTTEKIMKLNERLKGALSEIYLTAELLLSELIKAVRVHMGVLYRLSEITATLDLLLSYAQVSKMQNYVRPEFTDTLALQSCLNPLHDRLSNQETIANHVFASRLSNFTVVTGTNMSGKSMYIKQIALVQIMAQIGCFISAQYASLRLTDHLFTRIGVDDDIQSNSSTFTIEMREMSYIINSITDNSLVLIDELGRGTSFDEGFGICFAICENLLQTNAFIFVATHFTELTKLETLYANVQNLFFEVKKNSELDDDNDHLIFTYRCIKGVCPHNNHGMKLAKLSNLPVEMIVEAERIYQQLNSSNELIIKKNQQDRNSLIITHEINGLCSKLESLANEVIMETPELKNYLKILQNQCKIVLEKFEN